MADEGYYPFGQRGAVDTSEYIRKLVEENDRLTQTLAKVKEVLGNPKTEPVSGEFGEEGVMIDDDLAIITAIAIINDSTNERKEK